MNAQPKVPVTILTGFLGSGKTTLLNRILSEEHGKRIAVIENEYGEVGIDQSLVINADEEIFVFFQQYYANATTGAPGADRRRFFDAVEVAKAEREVKVMRFGNIMPVRFSARTQHISQLRARRSCFAECSALRRQGTGRRASSPRASRPPFDWSRDG